MGTTLVSPRKRGSNLSSLTDQQEIFVRELLADDLFSTTEAARRAGYKNPSQAANKLLKNPVIQAALGKRQYERSQRLEIEGDRILQEVAACALRDPLDLCDEQGRIMIDDLSKIPERMRRAIDGIKVKQHTNKEGEVTQTIELRLVPKATMLELAMKHLGLLSPTQHEVKHSLDWDSLYGEDTGVPDAIEARIAEQTTSV